MKTASANLQSSFAAKTAKLCRIIRVNRRDGTLALARTDLDRPVTFNGQVYEAKGIEISAVRNQINSARASGGTLTLILSNDGINTRDLQSGLYDGATFVLSIIDYANPSFGEMILQSGEFGDISFTERGVAEIEITSIIADLSRNIGEVYSQECRNDFGDSRCKIDVEALSILGIVDIIEASNVIHVGAVNGMPRDTYAFGRITFISGQNAGQSVEIFQSFGTRLTLALPPSVPLALGDAVRVYPGCAKTRTNCRFYNNLPNIRAEPDVPTISAQQAPIRSGSNTVPTAPQVVSETVK